MTIEVLVGIVAAVSGGLSTGAGIAAWLLKREMTRVVTAADRVPETRWFVRVEEKIDHLDPARMGEHYARVDAHATQLVDHEARLDHVEQQSDDHETRIRHVERG